MNKIEEQYVSFETAKLLKEKGFNEPCMGYYTEFVDNWKILLFWNKFKPKTYDRVVNPGYILVPTQSLVMRWLREVYYYHIEIVFVATSNFNAHIIDISQDIDGQSYLAKEECKNYEEACEAAIQYCLKKLIGYEK